MNLPEAARILGVPENADLRAVRRAYLKQVWRYHPDVQGPSEANHQNFIRIKRAYEVLKHHLERPAEKISSSTLYGRQVRHEILRRRQEQKKRRAAEAILASRLWCMASSRVLFLRAMYGISFLFFVGAPPAWFFLLLRAVAFPIPDALAVCLGSLMVLSLPWVFCFQFLIHMRFVWDQPK
ncbi:MAG: J domain-containing protein [Flavobacteriales bacterium]|nr:J domain-containing protein [Flavobacteriales bacterium]MDW8431204.1 J domain-containing protein [Flavobacteriales bacterium]